MTYIILTKENIKDEHICCAFSDKKCAKSYEAKKRWLSSEFENGYVFRRLDERAKVFIEYGPAEKAWVPVTAPGYIMIGCFWVSGQYKGAGHGKALLQAAIDEAKKQGKKGLVTVVGTKKYHFMSDTKWLLRQGFEICESTTTGFNLISLNFNESDSKPYFKDSARKGNCSPEKGIVVYYSNGCPYSEFHVQESLVETALKRTLPLKTIKLESMEQAQSCPSPATIFSLYLDGKFITTDISVCMGSRFDRIVGER
jgi:GNAT superfamily N-acetyltransferase